MSDVFQPIVLLLKNLCKSKLSLIILNKIDCFLSGEKVKDAQLIQGKIQGIGCSDKDNRKVKLFYESGKTEIVEPIENLNESFENIFGKYVYHFRWNFLNEDSAIKIFMGENGAKDIIVYKSGLVGYAE